MSVLLEHPLFFVFAYLFVCIAGSCWLLRDIGGEAHHGVSLRHDDENPERAPALQPERLNR